MSSKNLSDIGGSLFGDKELIEKRFFFLARVS